MTESKTKPSGSHLTGESAERLAERALQRDSEEVEDRAGTRSSAPKSMPLRGTMNHDEFEDRYRALEALTVQLIRHMMRHDVLSRQNVEDLMDSLANVSEGDRGSMYCAERLKDMIEGSGPMMASEMVDRDWQRAEVRASIYGGEPLPLDL